MTPATRRGALAAALALTGALSLGACSDSGAGSGSGSGSDTDSPPELKVSGAYMPQPVTADMAAGFLIIENTGGTGDRLTSVTSEISDDVQMHETVDQQMQRVKSLPVPAGGKLELSRGGNHLMFLGLEDKPLQGDEVSVRLHFKRSDPVKLSLPVEATNHTPEK